MALAQEAEPGDPLRECWLAHERFRVSEARSINRAEILTARTNAAAEAAEFAAAEATAAEPAATAEASGAVEIFAAAEAAAAAGGAAKAAAESLGARAALLPSCRKSLAATRAAWPRTPRRPRAARVLCGGPREIDNSQFVAQQRGSKRGSPGQEIDTDQSIEITCHYRIIFYHRSSSLW
jgi:hypothetical protein